MSPFFVQLSFVDDSGSTFEPGSEAYRHFSESFALYFFDMCSIDFRGHPETSKVGAGPPSTPEHGGWP